MSVRPLLRYNCWHYLLFYIFRILLKICLKYSYSGILQYLYNIIMSDKGIFKWRSDISTNRGDCITPIIKHCIIYLRHISNPPTKKSFDFYKDVNLYMPSYLYVPYTYCSGIELSYFFFTKTQNLTFQHHHPLERCGNHSLYYKDDTTDDYLYARLRWLNITFWPSVLVSLL